MFARARVSILVRRRRSSVSATSACIRKFIFKAFSLDVSRARVTERILVRLSFPSRPVEPSDCAVAPIVLRAMHALTRARNAGTRAPDSFRVALERGLSRRPLELASRVESDVAPTCVDLETVERRYLLVGGIDGGARVYDTERRGGDERCYAASGPASSSATLVCEIVGGGARPAGGGARRGEGAETRYATTSDEIGHAYATSCARWLPTDTGVFFTGSYDGRVKCWDANCLRAATETTLASKCRAVALSARATSHSLVAIGSDDDIVRLWDPVSNVIAHTLSGHRGSVHAIEWLRSNEHALATGGAEGDVRLWDIRRAGAYMILDRHNTQATARVDSMRDAMYAGSSGNGVVEAGPKPASRKMADSVPNHLRADSARRCSSSGWGRSSSGGGGALGGSSSRKRARDGGWGGWGVGFRGARHSRNGGDAEALGAGPSRARDGYSSIAAPAHDGQVSSLATTPCGMFLISTGADARVRRWDLSNGLNAYTPYDAAGLIPTAAACQIAITADGERLFVPCTDGRVRAFRTTSGALDCELRGHLDDVFACAHKDGGDAELFTCGKDANVLVWSSTPFTARGDSTDVFDGDAWSDEDEDDNAEFDRSGRPTTAADPLRAGPRGLGYRRGRVG